MSNQQLQFTEEDIVSVVLSDLKRVVREYATAATESNCQQTRQMFTDLLNTTLSLQGQLFTAMSNNNMYETPTEAIKKDIATQIQSYTQTQQQTNTWLNQGFQAGIISGAGFTNNMTSSQNTAH